MFPIRRGRARTKKTIWRVPARKSVFQRSLRGWLPFAAIARPERFFEQTARRWRGCCRGRFLSPTTTHIPRRMYGI